jgi:hypothetical protein
MDRVISEKPDHKIHASQNLIVPAGTNRIIHRIAASMKGTRTALGFDLLVLLSKIIPLSLF